MFTCFVLSCFQLPVKLTFKNSIWNMLLFVLYKLWDTKKIQTLKTTLNIQMSEIQILANDKHLCKVGQMWSIWYSIFQM